MKHILPTQKKLLTLAIGLSLTAILNGCSSDKPETPKSDRPAINATDSVAPHSDVGEASDKVKKQFAKEFAANCVARELKKSVNPDNDKKRVEPACTCIANRMAEDLAEADAEKYLQEHEDTHTLQIHFDSAAYFCVQENAHPQGPKIIRKL